MIVKSISAIIFKDFVLVRLVHFGFGHSLVTRLNLKKKKNIFFMLWIYFHETFLYTQNLPDRP